MWGAVAVKVPPLLLMVTHLFFSSLEKECLSFLSDEAYLACLCFFSAAYKRV